MRSMKRTFQKWLLLLVLFASLFNICINYMVVTKQAHSNAMIQIDNRLDSVVERIQRNEESISFVKTKEMKSILEKARAASELLEIQPDKIMNFDYLKKLTKKLGLNGIYITDEEGTVVSNYPDNSLGFNMGSNDESRQYLKILKDPTQEIAEEPRKVSSELTEGKMLYQQFAGVARPDHTGILQVSQAGSEYDDILRLSDMEHVAEGVWIGQEGFVFIYEEETICSSGIPIDTGDDVNKLEIKTNQDTSQLSAKINGNHMIGIERTEGKYRVVGVMPEAEVYEERNNTCRILLIGQLGLFLVVFILVTVLLDEIVMKGLNRTREGLVKITEGNLDQIIDVRTNREFDSLSNGINTMVEELKHAIEREADRLAQELQVAKEIQMSALPKLEPPFTGQKQFMLASYMGTAKEVGGDFYDYFFVDEDNIVFLVADVSGKGIPAALFMMQSKTLIRKLLEAGHDIGEAIRMANKNLHENNEKGMFVTAWVGMLRLSDGTLHYVNAGHNPPIWLRVNQENEWMKRRSGLLLGSFEGVSYKTYECKLEAGDAIFLYTDGVTEAVSTTNGMYGEKRLFELLAKPFEEPKECISKVESSLREFAKGEEQADDITMVMIQYRGTSGAETECDPTITWNLSAEIEVFEDFNQQLEQVLLKNEVDKKSIKKLLIATEEIFVNIVHYAYPEKEGEVTIRLVLYDEADILLSFEDSGIAFNPLEKDTQPLSAGNEDLPIGGLGILMVKKMMSEVKYSRTEDGHNVLKLHYKKEKSIV